MMKKFTLMLLCLALALPAFSLAEEAAASPALPAFEWERNGLGHWHVLENGEKVDSLYYHESRMPDEVMVEMWIG